MNDERLNIGIINFSNESVNEAVIGRPRIRNLGDCVIEVYTNDNGAMPHFHLHNRDNTFACCICIYSANYFNHNNKYRDKLNNKQCKELDTWLRLPNPKYNSKVTNWEVIKGSWESNNQSNSIYVKLQKTDVQPDYTNMINYRDL